VFQKKVLRRIFGSKRDEVTEEWRKLHNEELNDLYSPSIFRVIKSRKMRWAENVVRIDERGGLCWVLVRKPEGRIPLGRPGCSWENNMKTDVQEVGCGDVDWIELAVDKDRWRALVYAVMNLRVSYSAVNFLTSCKPITFSRRTLLKRVS
jgi:hypothetical protein